MTPARHSSRRRSLAWTAAVAVPLVVSAGVLLPMAASGTVDLPDKTPKQLIEFASASTTKAFSGTIEQTSALGLPDLGALTGDSDGEDSAANSGDLLDLVTGSHTARVYLDGSDARFQVLDRLGERNVYVDGDAEEAWFVDSETQTATRFTGPSDADREKLDREKLESGKPESGKPEKGDDRALPTPDQLLDGALARLDETTDVTVGTDARVAGRDVYELILTPRTPDTLVGELRFAIDGETGVALSASITARGADTPAFQLRFTQVDFAAPDASVFAFTPGPDTTVTEKPFTLPSASDLPTGGWPESGPELSVEGTGWSSVVATSALAGGSPLESLPPEQTTLLNALTTPVEGGRALQTALVSVLLTDDGRVLAGAVPVSRLVEAASTGR